MALHRHTVVSMEKVIPALQAGFPAIELEGFKLRLDSNRIRTYTKGVVCVTCGIAGSFFAIEESYPVGELPKGKGHLNLYAINCNGTEVMMTSDHIVPRFVGGKDSVSNRQPMCIKCNGEKGHKTEDTEAWKKALEKKIEETKYKLRKLSQKENLLGCTQSELSRINSYQSSLRRFRAELAAM